MKKIELGDNVCWYTPKGHIKGFLAKHHGNHKYCHGKIGVCISDKKSDMITIEDNTASRMEHEVLNRETIPDIPKPKGPIHGDNQ